MKKRTFLMWGQDLEMQTIKEILDQSWEKILDKNLWRWAKIDAYKDELAQIADQNVYACELEWAGQWDYLHVESLDHHGQRAHEKATILQVLDILGKEPSMEYKLIAANDSGYIPAMMEFLKSEWICDPNEIQKMISLIRFKDRQAQWISQEQEDQAQKAIQTKEELLDGKLTVVKLAHSKGATITDRLFGKYQNLLILSGDGEVKFYGDGKICEDLKNNFEGRNCWSWLGEKGWNAYRWWYPKHDEVKKFVEDRLKEEKVLYHMDLVWDTLKLKFGEAASNNEIVRYVEHQLKQKIEKKEILGGEIIKLDWPASLPVAVVLTHKLAHLYGAIAVWDPKLGKFVVSVSHSGKFEVWNTLE